MGGELIALVAVTLGMGVPPRRAVYLLSGPQAAQRRAACGDRPRSRHSDGA
jgi:hypothetical protein